MLVHQGQRSAYPLCGYAAIFSPSKKAIDNVIKLLQQSYDLTDEEELKDYLGVRIQKNEDGSVKMHHKRSIDQCLKIAGVITNDDVKTKFHNTPALTEKTFQ